MAEHGIAPFARTGFARVVQVVVQFHVDKKLRVRGVRVVGSCHRDGSTQILQAIVGFVIYRVTRGFLHHVGGETSALDHEVADDPVENGAVIETVPRILQEILDSLRGFVLIELKRDVPFVGVQHHDGVAPRGAFLGKSGAAREKEQGGQTDQILHGSGFLVSGSMADSTALRRRIASDEYSDLENQPFGGGDMVE